MVEINTTEGEFNSLLPSLQRLKWLLEHAVEKAEVLYGSDAAADRFRGLYINHRQIVQLLRRQPGQPLLNAATRDDNAFMEHMETAESDEEEQAAIEIIPARRSWFSRVKQGFIYFFTRLFRLNSETETGLVRAAQPTNSDSDAASSESHTSATSAHLNYGSRFELLQQTYGLSSFDLDVMLIALAPEIDLDYGRLYAYLQDNVSRRWPSVDLVLNLLCKSPDDKIACRTRFSPQAPLLNHQLLKISADREGDTVPLLAHYLQLDGQIIRFLLGEQTLDPRLSSFSQLHQPEIYGCTLLPDELVRPLHNLIKAALDDHQPLRIYLQGPSSTQALNVAECITAKADSPLLVVDLAKTLQADLAYSWLPTVICREAWLQDAILFLSNAEPLLNNDNRDNFEVFTAALAAFAGVVIIAGNEPWRPSEQTTLGMITIPLTMPGFEERAQTWRAHLTAACIWLDDDDIARLAGRFQLDSRQIAEAAAAALNQRRLTDAATDGAYQTSLPTLTELSHAARAQSGHDLVQLSRKITPIYEWQDIILPEDTRAQLREMCQRVDWGHRVLDDWGFKQKLSQGKGLNALFVGPSGTGKTMAAEIMANELSLDLYKIDLSGVVSKYIGETEKNLDRVFQAAQRANAILFFDEADALFGKRSEVRDSHDRYANIEISYLLQKMEEHDGITILATNLRQNLDEAFVRRVAFTVHFPFPNDESRLRIWQSVWPNEKLLADDVDLAYLAQNFRLSGGNIRNVALAAAFLAANSTETAHGAITLAHILCAIRREYQKMGKVLTNEELTPYRLESVM